MKKVAINGFGRIGRLALRRILESSESIEVVAINVTRTTDQLAYIFKYDTAHGNYQGTVETEDDALVIDGKRIQILGERDVKNIDWAALGVDVVLDCTGVYTKKEKAQDHLDSGAKRVLISAPGSKDMKTVVYGINHETIGDELIVSNSSCTTNCLAPMVKVLNDSFGIKNAVLKTVHAYTGNQALQDAPPKDDDWRRERAAALSIIPTTTGAARIIGLVLPELDGKIDGTALRVPVIDGSITLVTCTLEKKVTVEEINEAMKAAETDSYGYTEDPIVSADILGSTQGGIFDATQTTIVEADGEQIIEISAWYDNEYGYVSQLVRTLEYLASLTE